MSAAAERQAGRDAAIRAILPAVPELGWTLAVVRREAAPGADLLFPGGSVDLVEAYIDMANRDMVAAAAPALAEQKLSRRVRTLVATRLEQAGPHKAAVRRAAAVLTRPDHALAAARCTARTVEAIWSAAGDVSADFSWYTKRAILGSVYTATLLYWLGDHDLEESLAFLDRRLEGVARIGKLRRRLGGSRAA